MTKRERAQVVELLRCAADGPCPGIEGAARDLGHGDEYEDKIYALAMRAWYAVPIAAKDSYRSLCLEAAVRVEEGSWP